METTHRPKRGKLTFEQAEEIRAAHAAGENPKLLAQRYGVTPSAVYQILSGHVHRPDGMPLPPRRKKGRPRKHFPTPCECGCGGLAKPSRRYINGHQYRCNDGWRSNPIFWPRTNTEWISEMLANCKLEDRGYKSQCMIWSGYVNSTNGYAVVTYKGVTTTRHRLMYELVTGEKLTSQFDCHHLCGADGYGSGSNGFGSRCCLRPDHLVAKRRGHHMQLHHSHLTQTLVDEMRELAADGWSHSQLGERYGIAPGSAGNIVRGVRWKDESASV